jgi:uncharacterized protein YggE
MRGLILVLAFVNVAFAAAAAQEPAPAQASVIVTTGEAVVERPPDQAFVGLAVETRARSPRDAQRQNAEAMTAVQGRIAAAGVPKDAVRTLGYNIQQEFDFADGRRTPREFVARNGIEVRLDSLDKVGDLLDAVVQAGATTVTGVRFELKDRSAAEREALRLAVVDARGRADAAAAGAGKTVDRVLRIDDSRAPMVVPLREPMMAVRAGAPQATPIESGTIEIHAQVTLTVSMK